MKLDRKYRSSIVLNYLQNWQLSCHGLTKTRTYPQFHFGQKFCYMAKDTGLQNFYQT